MKVLVTDKINEAAGRIIEAAAEVDFLPTMNEDELVKVIGNYDALMVRSQTKVTPKIIEAGKNLKIKVKSEKLIIDNICPIYQSRKAYQFPELLISASLV